MGVGRRMKKQGPPPSLEEFNASLKRKAGEPEIEKSSVNKRRKADDTKTHAHATHSQPHGKIKRPLLKEPRRPDSANPQVCAETCAICATCRRRVWERTRGRCS